MVRAAALLLAVCVGACAPVAVAVPEVAAPTDGSMLNFYRASQGLAPVARSGLLQQAAAAHAADLAAMGRVSHVGSDGGRLGTRLARVGYGYTQAAENLALTPGGADAAITLWTGSAGHRANMLLPGVTDYGLAQNGDYWVLVLGRR